MAMDSTYYKDLNGVITRHYRELSKQLPDYAQFYIKKMETLGIGIQSIKAYTYDLIYFFEYLSVYREFGNPSQYKLMKEITLQDLDTLTDRDFTKYMSYLMRTTMQDYKDAITRSGLPIICKEPVQDKAGNECYKHNCKPRTIARKLVVIRKMFTYYHIAGEMNHNPMEYVMNPKFSDGTENGIRYIKKEKVLQLFEGIETGVGLTKHERGYYTLTRYRDIAILQLLLNTGIRVSECTGIDLKDIKFEENSIEIVRKGNRRDTIIFNMETRKALLDYLTVERSSIIPEEGHEDALFLSLQKRRLTARSIENMVNKYTSCILGEKFSPHRLRDSFGTRMYEKTNGDAKLTSELLGHKSVETAAKYYISLSKERRAEKAMDFSYEKTEEELKKEESKVQLSGINLQDLSEAKRKMIEEILNKD